jgi:Ribbon-helix-helix protein, copG family
MHTCGMRTTLTLDPDVAAEVERIRRVEGVGMSEALNRLARRALAIRPQRGAYVPLPAELGLMIDVSNIGEVLDLLDHEAP